MDKVQIYYLVTLVLGLTVVVIRAVESPDEPCDKYTNRQTLYFYPPGLLLSLPVIGRIFGWW